MTPLVSLFVIALSLGFASNPVAEGNGLFREGKYDEAIAKYGEALVDDPDSALLNFNMGAAHYKAGRYADAVASYSRVNTAGDPSKEAKVAYNIANAQYQEAAAKESANPKEALEGYAKALVSYRRAIGADSTSRDAKHNYEFVYHRMLDLKRRMEEEQKKKEEEQQQQDQQQEDQPQGDQPPSDEQDSGAPPQPKDTPNQSSMEPSPTPEPKPGGSDAPPENGERQEGESPEPGEPQPEPEAGEPEPQPQEPPSQEPSEAGQAEPGENGGNPQAGGRSKEEEQARERAASVIDMAAEEELDPSEFTKKIQGAAVLEPAQDW